jgi:Viral (Superfamily 1) RNA helicase.
MEDNDTFEKLKLPLLFQKNQVFHSFITQEITKQVDLVIHLIDNSTAGLVILGPDGVGKSTLIAILQNRRKGSWLYCIIKAKPDLTLPTLRAQIDKIKSKNVFDKRYKQFVLIIDDATSLQAGIIDTIINQSLESQQYRVILLFTHEEYELKTATDSVLNDCYLLEISPLNKTQCADFLQFLDPSFSNYLEYDEFKIDEIYAETQGLPGKIIELLPSKQPIKQTNYGLLFLIIGVISLILLALVTQFLTDPDMKNKLLHS